MHNDQRYLQMHKMIRWNQTSASPHHKRQVLWLRRIGRSARLSGTRPDSWTSDRWDLLFIICYLLFVICYLSPNNSTSDGWERRTGTCYTWHEREPSTCIWAWQGWDRRPRSPSASVISSRRQAWSHLSSAWSWGRRTAGPGHSKISPQPDNKKTFADWERYRFSFSDWKGFAFCRLRIRILSRADVCVGDSQTISFLAARKLPRME